MLINLGLLCVVLLHDSTWWLISWSSQMQLPFNNIPSAKQAYMKHCELGHVWRSAVLHTMHNSWDRRALICTKSACVFYPPPIRCDKPTGAELMLLKSCTSRHVLLSDVFSRLLPLWKEKSCEWTQSHFRKQKSSVLPRRRLSVPCVTPFLDSYLYICFPSPSLGGRVWWTFLLPRHVGPHLCLCLDYPSHLYHSIKGKALVDKLWG